MTPLARAAVIAVGSEMLTPQRLDTNSLFITTHLNTLGLDVIFKAIVGDDRGELAALLTHALARVDLVVCCGGLGPTDDDVTREVVAGVLGCTLREDETITAHLRDRYARRFSGPMPEINRRQAMVPDGARVLSNARGSAPGLWMEAADRLVLLLPGPPRELKPMVEGLVPLLRERAAGRALLRRVIKIAGRIESQTEEQLRPLYAEWRTWPLPIEATILAALGQLELHLSARAEDVPAVDAALDRAVTQVCGVLGEDVFSIDGAALEAVVGNELRRKGYRIAVAESCTGGLILSRLTDVAGSSDYVQQGVVVYSNAAKTALLGVPPDVLAAHGAVSEAVASAMASAVRERAGVEVGLAVTGIAGPGGGSEAKPVGTVAVAASIPSAQFVRTFRFHGERDQIKFQASQAALDMVRRMLMPR